MNPAAFEQTLCRVPGIEAARVVMSAGSPSEVHVIAVPSKPAKQVVRDVQSVALAAFGTAVDRRIISVVQMDESALAGGDRPAVGDIAEEVDGSRMTMTVTLTWHDLRLVGSATGPAAVATRLKLVADATVRSLEQALDADAAFAVQAAETASVGIFVVAVAVVVIVVGGAERHVVGSALVDGDPGRAMVRAVLDALNRQVPTLKRS
jgi:hypothetical protein